MKLPRISLQVSARPSTSKSSSVNAFLVSLIRREPERYLVFFEAVMVSDPMITQHVNDDWNLSLVERSHDKEGRFYLWCHKCECSDLNPCDCIEEVQKFRDGAGLTDKKD